MRVRVYKPSESAMQAACGCHGQWRIEPVLPTPRAPEPLMGWTSADDPFSCLQGRLTFATQGEAVSFARARGWDYAVETPSPRVVQPKSYADNFNPDRRRDGR